MGSSPLARGLHRRTIVDSLLIRIIPARAGFTEDVLPGREGHEDHPRSRGVYATVSAKDMLLDGSSPLARGLLSCVASLVGLLGIIPARAGFTVGPQARRVAHPDHPRSRGVYVADPHQRQDPPGSSPLARGLPAAHQPGHRRRGIIPARAGFTDTYMIQDISARDHPRSRGVYGICAIVGVVEPGSSPLARGLRCNHAKRSDTTRIIPARAGFTKKTPSGALVARDHPRSRGVYTLTPKSAKRMRGSSPLARGLLQYCVAVGCRSRIIPARAGFTAVPDDHCSRRKDHPRSRGVYPPDSAPNRHAIGSSPLARGLPGFHRK